MEDRYIYILLTRTNTLFSRLIHYVTGDEYTHAAIGVEGPGGSFYGFGRKYPRFPFPGGFRKECPWRFSHAEPCRIYRVRVSDAGYRRISKLLKYMYEEREKYHYNIAGVIALWLRWNPPMFRDDHFFCSQFVYWALAVAGIAPVDETIDTVKPIYFCSLPQASKVFEGYVVAPELLHIN